MIRIGLIVAFASGLAALAHELLWTRRLVDLLGGTSESNTRVLSLFFLGLSAGALIAYRLLPSIARPWRAAAGAEWLVALFASTALFLPGLTDWIWPLLGAERLVGPLGSLIKLAISVVVIVPAATAMGATLPFFVTAILADRGRLSREGLWIYAANTFGGLCGLLLIGGLVLPVIGGSATMAVAIAINASLGIACFLLDRQAVSAPRAKPAAAKSDGAQGGTPSHEPPVTAGDEADPPALGGQAVGPPADREDPPISRAGVASVRMAWLCAAGSGAGLLASEIVVVQAMMLAVPFSFFAPLAVLSTVILLLAVAAPLASRLITLPGRGPSWWLPRSLATAGVIGVLSPFWYMLLTSRMGVETGETVTGFTLRVASLSLLAFGPFFFVVGLTFPLAIALYGQTAGPRADRRWPWLLAVNGVGGLVGAELAYRFLLPTFGIHTGLGVVAVAYLALAAVVAALSDELPLPSPWSLGGLTLVSAAFVSGYVTRLPQINPYLGFEVLSERVSADGLVSVVEGPGFGRGILVSNQYMLGSVGVRYDQQRQAHLPLMLHPDPRQAAFIGLATGITPGAALRHEAVDHVTVAEISREVVRAADRFFLEHNEGVTRSDRASIRIEDGRTFVAASPARFDVLVGDLYLPWGAGASRLYSREHFRAARRSLNEGGLFCQWLPMYQLRPDHFLAIAATFQDVFPQTYLFRNGADPMQPAVALVGFRSGNLDWGVVDRRVTNVRDHGRILDPSVTFREAVGMHFLGTLRPIPSDIPRITLNNMLLEVVASRERVTGNPGAKYLQGVRWIEFLNGELTERTRPESATDVAKWQALGRLLVNWEWAHRAEDPAAPILRRQIVGRLPVELAEAIREAPEVWGGNAAVVGP